MAVEFIPRWEEAMHFGFDFREIGFGNFGSAEIKVVVKAVVYSRTDGTLGLGPELNYRCGQKIGGLMT